MGEVEGIIKVIGGEDQLGNCRAKGGSQSRELENGRDFRE